MQSIFMDQELTREIAQKLMEIKGEVRGVAFWIDKEYVLKEEGEEGLKMIEKELEKFGQPIKYRKIETFKYYPVGLRALSLLAIKKAFNFNDKEIERMGFFGTKVSMIVKFFIKYVFSPQKAFSEQASKIWRKHWTIGNLIPVELNEKKKYAVLRLQNFSLHPIYCTYLGGYFCGVLSMLVKTTQITFEETKCIFRGDEYHEYLIKWQQ